ncbi:uncharacterized protein LOC134311937 [Trichomycterus rosablanca]|uniref:uncharacterized protein LOC134311937 n=1 Tax=Trichomycterus rosablanca TaxID=2290929 RepID=UPI002F355754
MVKIFVGNLPSQAENEELKGLFAQYGTVTECAIIKNFAFVHMDDRKNATKAIRNLHLYKLHGTPINVEASTGKNQGPVKIHVANVEKGAEDELRALFEEYGTVTECAIIKNFAFVHMGNSDEASDAIKGLDNSDFQGKRIHVQISKSRPRGGGEDDYDYGYWQPSFPAEPMPPGPPGYPRGRFGPPVAHSYPPAPPPPPRRPPFPGERDSGVVDYYEKYRARPYGMSSYEEGRPIPPPPPPPSAIRERMAPTSLDPYDRRPPPPPSFYRDRSPVGRVPVPPAAPAGNGYSYERPRLSDSSRNPMYAVPRSRDSYGEHVPPQHYSASASTSVKLQHRKRCCDCSASGDAISFGFLLALDFVRGVYGTKKSTVKMVKIFVGNLAPSTTKDDIHSLFSNYGQVKECDVLRNFGFVHMDSQKEAEEAVSKLHQHVLNGQSMNVEMSKGKPKGTTKLHVSNISENCTNQDLQAKFEEFGAVIECDIVKDYAFVHMEKKEDAVDAIREMDNSTFQGKLINVQLSTSRLRTIPGMGDITGCYVCGEQGHWSKDCRRGQNGSYGGSYGPRSFPRAGPPSYSSVGPAGYPSRSYPAALPHGPPMSHNPSYVISRDYGAEARYLSKPMSVYPERSAAYEPDRYSSVDYYEKYRARPFSSSYLEDRRVAIPPPPPISSSTLSRMRLAPSSLDPYDRRALPQPPSAATAYYARDRSPIRRVGADAYSYERSRLSPVARSTAFGVSRARDPATEQSRYDY